MDEDHTAESSERNRTADPAAGESSAPRVDRRAFLGGTLAASVGAVVVPSGVSARTDGTSDALQNVVTVSGESSNLVNYQFAVSGSARRSRANGATVDAEDAVFDRGVPDTTAYGITAAGTDSYEYSGSITALDASDDPVTVTVDGREVDPDDYPDKPGRVGGLPNTITLSSGTSERLYYQFETTGRLVHSRANGATVDAENLVVGTTAYGILAGGIDSYEYAGDIRHFDVHDGPVSVSVNGRERDADDLVDEPDGTGVLSNRITIYGESSDLMYYQFETTGGAVHSRANGATVDPEDLVTDRVLGITAGGTDCYGFSGTIRRFEMTDGPATITVNGREVGDPEGEP